MIKRLFLMSLVLSLLLSLANNVYAVTEFISTINRSGEDYNTISSWEAATDNAGNITDGTVLCGGWDTKTGTIPADTVTVDWDGGSSTGTIIHVSESNGGSGGDQYLIDVTSGSLADDDVILDIDTSTDGFTIDGIPDSCIITAECYDDDGTLNNSVINFSGVTTDSTNYRKVTVLDGERHNGVLPNGTAGDGFILDCGASDCIDIAESNFVLEWIAIDCTGANSTFDHCLTTSNNDTPTFIRNLVVAASPTHNNVAINCNEPNPCNVFNSITYNTSSVGIGIRGSNRAGSANFFYNNSSSGFATGINAVDTKTTIKNCVSSGSTNDYSGTPNAASTHNASGDATAPALNTYYRNAIVNFTSATDLHLTSSSTSLIDKGTDLGTSTDIDGDDRDTYTPWDIGADEYVSAGEPSARRFLSL